MSASPNNTAFNLTYHCLHQHAKDTPERDALIIVNEIGDHQIISYHALYQAVCQLSAGLASLQLPPFSVVGIHFADPLDTILCCFSAIAANLVAMPLLYSMTQDEISYITKNADCKLLLTGKNDLKMAHPVRVLRDDEMRALKHYPAKDLSPTTTLHDPAFIFYTSGSTGKPKGVLHGQRMILGRLPSIAHWLPLGVQDVVMQSDNICWTYSMGSGVLDPLLMGACAVIYAPINRSAKSSDSVSGATWLDLMNYYQVTTLAATPDTYAALLSIPHFDKKMLQALKQAGSAGAPLPQSTQDKWQASMGFPIYTALGMSEISTFICTGPAIAPRPGKIGKIQPGRKIRIVPINATLKEVAADEHGLLAINREENGFMLKYIGQAHQGTYREDWFITSDLVSQDREGYITYYGRNDLVLKVDGGYRVSPIEIENALKECAHVLDALCTGNDEAETEAAMLSAYVVLDIDSTLPIIKHIYQQLSESLSDYKIPDVIHVVAELKHSERGKMIRGQKTPVLQSYYKNEATSSNQSN